MEETTKTYGFTGNLAAKVGAFILAVILFVLTVGGCLGAYLMLENDFYTVSEESAVASVLESAVTSYQYQFGRIYDSYLKNEEDESNYRYGVSEMRRVMKGTNIIGVSISDATGELLYSYSDVAGTTLYLSFLLGYDIICSVPAKRWVRKRRKTDWKTDQTARLI